MKMKHSINMKIAIVALMLSLTACSGASEPSANQKPQTPTNEAVTTPAPAPEPENETAPEVTRPQEENFDVMTGEGNKSYTAALQEGKDFSLYVFDTFSFDAAEGRLSLTSNPEYHVLIESLPADYDLTQLEQAGKEELEGFGDIFDYSGELVEHPLGFAELYLQTSSAEGIHDYIVWKSEAGEAFLFRLHNPKDDEAADFAGLVLVSLSTVQR